MVEINQKRLALIAAACMILMAGSYLVFLTATWVQFQADRNSRTDKIDELLDRIPRPTDGTVHDHDAEGEVQRVRDTDQKPPAKHPSAIRNETSPVLRAVPQQTPPAPAT